MGAFSLFLIAVGAILTFAINAAVEGIELSTVGVILMIVGAIGVVAAIARGEFGTFGRRRTERHVSPDGRHVYEETHHV